MGGIAQPLAWELPYTATAALKEQMKKKKKRKEKRKGNVYIDIYVDIDKKGWVKLL